MQSFNLLENQKAERKLFGTYVDVSGKHPDDQDWVPEWEVVGAGVEESSVELNPDTETTTDVLGITETSINKLEETQTFEPNTARGGQKLNPMLHDIIDRRALTELSLFTVLRAYSYLGAAGTYKAYYDKNCTINVTSLGGSAHVDMPIEISFSGDRVHGTVDKMKNPVFTKTP